MGHVHVLYPSLFRDPIGIFRRRFPGPWSVLAVDGGYGVVDEQNARLITIEASGPERPDRMPVGQAFALAKAIARLGDRRR